MSLEAPITIKQEAVLLETRLTAWAEPRGAAVEIKANMRHVWETVMSLATDGQPKLMICYTGEQARGGFNNQDDLHRVDRQWKVIVMRGHGFKKMLVDGVDDQPQLTEAEAFYDVLESLRDAIRVALDISEEFPVNYKGMSPLPNVAPGGTSANIFMDAMQIDFSTANDIPAVLLEDPAE